MRRARHANQGSGLAARAQSPDWHERAKRAKFFAHSGIKTRRRQRRQFLEAQHQVQVLQHLSGAAFDQVIERAEYGYATLVSFDRTESETDLGAVRTQHRDHLWQSGLRHDHTALTSISAGGQASELVFRNARGHA